MHIVLLALLGIIIGIWADIHDNAKARKEKQWQLDKINPPKPIVKNKYDNRGDNSSFCGSYNDFGSYGK